MIDCWLVKKDLILCEVVIYFISFSGGYTDSQNYKFRPGQ